MEQRLGKLLKLWPPKACRDCRERPAIYCIEREDDPVPDFPEGRCPVCDTLRVSVPIVVDIDCDAI